MFFYRPFLILFLLLQLSVELLHLRLEKCLVRFRLLYGTLS
jgi:hypothetical protein